MVAELFTHFYHMRNDGAARWSIGEIDRLFDLYAAPKQMCTVILVRDR
jgi:hypothetical protein